METLEFQVEIASNKELVWFAWTQTDRIVKWFAPDANIEARVGGAFELFFDPTNHDHLCTKGCTITLLEPMERLGFTWRGPDEFDIMNHEDSLTSVLVTLSEDNGVTRVLIEHTGWGQGSEWEKARAWHQMAWNQVLGSLKSALESGEGELCCAP